MNAMAVEWILKFSVGAKEDEIIVLCDYYNEFIGTNKWSEDNHTMMMVLNRYNKIKTDTGTLVL